MELLTAIGTSLAVLAMIITPFFAIGAILVILRNGIDDLKDQLKKPTESKSNTLPYIREKYLMNIPEKKFFKKLKFVLPDGYAVFPQVSLNSILKTKSGKDYMKYQNKINRKIMDFVVFKLPNYNPELVIEYDGRTHKRRDRVKRDKFLDKALKSANLEVVHFKHRRNVSLEDIKNILQETSIFSINKSKTKVKK